MIPERRNKTYNVSNHLPFCLGTFSGVSMSIDPEYSVIFLNYKFKFRAADVAKIFRGKILDRRELSR